MIKKIFLNRKSSSLKLISVIAVSVFLLSGCKALEDFTHMKVLEISSFSPSSSRVNSNSLKSVKISFSEENE